MDFPRWLCVLTVAVTAMITGAASAATAGSNPAAPSVHYVRQTVSSGPDAGDEQTLSGYYEATLQPASRAGTQLLLAPIWSHQVDAAGRASYLMDLDPNDATEAAQLAVLGQGFSAAVTRSGGTGALRATNQGAWTALSRTSPEAANALLSLHQAPGLRPVQLPASVAVGDVVAGTLRIEPHGSVETKLQVIEVTPDAVLMAMSVAGPGAQGDGRLVVARGDGMPIELRMEVWYAASKGQPAAVHRVHLADTAYDPMLQMSDDVDSYVSYAEQVSQTLQRAPFSAVAPDPSAYTHRAAVLGELEDYMVGAASLPTLMPYMGAFWVAAESGTGRWLAIGARSSVERASSAGQGQHERILMSRLHSVAMLDADGAEIAGLPTKRVTPTLFFPEKYAATQNEVSFPFHLPLGAPRDALGRIEAVRMSVDAEVYAFETTEILQPGERSALNPDITLLRPAAHRATLLQGRQSWRAKTGLYSVVVPLDEDGNVLPSEQMTIAPLKPAQPTRLAQVPLAWENGRLPIRTEIATARPIAALQVRHYRWSSVPTTWTFPMRE
ncbi:hypothetical protein EDF77_3371 [Stenotrophomonas maltophilia]|uniref:hypothetical protein n=1 Tax=Stenotrophomonas chelatiphaga TaxID=517011 RepID=UPI000FACABD0|nr:hypothetical protein [Stenotrophomonas chelatiphaga]ROQ37704.1 hypothetical protein EDF77_3371 [Stenotrophomonas maltophilia]